MTTPIVARDNRAPRTTCEHCHRAITWDYGTHRWLRTNGRQRGTCRTATDNTHDPARTNT